MKRIVFFGLLCMMLAICFGALSEDREVCTYSINGSPQMQMTIDSSWLPTSGENSQNLLVYYETIDEYAHKDGVHKLNVYFIPYNLSFNPPAGHNLVQSILSSAGIQLHTADLNGASVLEGKIAGLNGFGLVVQDASQCGFFVVVGFPQHGTRLSDQDDVLKAIMGTIRDANHFDTALPSAEKEETPASTPAPQKEAEGDVSGDSRKQLEELQAQYDAALKLVEEKEEALLSLRESITELQARIKNLKAEQKDINSDARTVETALKAVQTEIDQLAPYFECAKCGFQFQSNDDFKFCPSCGTARSIPKVKETDLTEAHLTELREKAETLKSQLDVINGLAQEKQALLDEAASSLADLEKQASKVQDELNKAEEEVSRLSALLKSCLAELATGGKCVKCGYVFPEGSSFRFCPQCGMER